MEASMSPIVLVLVPAVVLGLLLGGSLRRFEDLHVHWWVLAFTGLALQVVPVPTIARVSPRVVGTVMLVASYGLLLSFIAVNRWIPAARIMAVGLLLNLLVVATNGGMPVSATAIERAGGSAAALSSEPSEKHHLMTEGDVLWFLGDVIPVPPPVKIVLSIGDLLLYLGMAWFVVQVMRGRSRGNPRPLALWFPSYRGKHAPSHWRIPARYRSHAAGDRSGSEP
jgi:hypothetical protein